MSDRLYLYAVPALDAPKITELHSTPYSLPFEPYTKDGVLFTHGSSRPNPRYIELAKFAFSLPSIYLAKWPDSHMRRLFLKWDHPTKDYYLEWLDFHQRGLTLPLPPDKGAGSVAAATSKSST